MKNVVKKPAQGKGNDESHCRTDQGNTTPVGNLPSSGGKGLGNLHRGAPQLGAGENRTARRDLGKTSGDPRRSGPVPAATGPAEGATHAVEIRPRFDAEDWQDIALAIEDIQCRVMSEKQRKAAAEQGASSSAAMVPGPEIETARTAGQDGGKTPGDPRRSDSVPADAGPAEDAAHAVEIRPRFDAEQWRILTLFAAHDHETPENWIRELTLEILSTAIEELRRRVMLEIQRKVEAEQGASSSAATVPGPKIEPAQTVGQDVVKTPANPIFSPQEERAIALCAEWMGMTYAALVREGVQFAVRAGFEDLEAFVKNPKADRKERAGARRLHRELAPIMAALDWDGKNVAGGRAEA